MKKITSYLKFLFPIVVLFLISVDIAEKANTPLLIVPMFVVMFLLALIPMAHAGVSTMAFTEGLCENIQRSLIDIYKNYAPELQRTMLGYVQALKSPINTQGVEIVPLDQKNGKTRSVRLTYIQRGLETGIVTTKPLTCVSTNEPAPFEEIVSIDKYIGQNFKFDETEMRKLCEKDSDYMAKVMNANFDALTKSLDKKLIVVQQSNFGAFEPNLVDAGLWKDVQMLNGSSNNAPLYYGESQVIEDFTNIGYTGKPIVIGAGNLSHYVRQTNIGCCNDNGIDLSQAANMYFFHDLNVNTLVGTNHFIAMRPGSVQLITVNDYMGDYRKENDVYSHGTVTDPFTGITWDMKWHYDDCAETYVLQLGLKYKQYFLPSDSFASGDDLFGVNGVLHYRATSSAPTYS